MEIHAAEWVRGDQPLLRGPVEGTMDEGDGVLLGPVGCPFRVGVDPAGEVERQAVLVVDPPEAVGLGEALEVEPSPVKRPQGFSVRPFPVAAGRGGPFSYPEWALLDLNQ